MPRDYRVTDSQHTIEIMPRTGHGAHTDLFIIAAETKADTQQAVDGAVTKATLDAMTLMREHPEYTSVGIYHSYPNGGPQRRYVGDVKPDFTLARPLTDWPS